MTNPPAAVSQLTEQSPSIDTRTACTVPEACKLLGDIGRSTLYVLIGAGKITALKLGGRTLITVASVDALLASLPRWQPNSRRAHEECGR